MKLIEYLNSQNRETKDSGETSVGAELLNKELIQTFEEFSPISRLEDSRADVTAPMFDFSPSRMTSCEELSAVNSNCIKYGKEGNVLIPSLFSIGSVRNSAAKVDLKNQKLRERLEKYSTQMMNNINLEKGSTQGTSKGRFPKQQQQLDNNMDKHMKQQIWSLEQDEYGYKQDTHKQESTLKYQQQTVSSKRKQDIIKSEKQSQNKTHGLSSSIQTSKKLLSQHPQSKMEYVQNKQTSKQLQKQKQEHPPKSLSQIENQHKNEQKKNTQIQISLKQKGQQGLQNEDKDIYCLNQPVKNVCSPPQKDQNVQTNRTQTQKSAYPRQDVQMSKKQHGHQLLQEQQFKSQQEGEKLDNQQAEEIKGYKNERRKSTPDEPFQAIHIQQQRQFRKSEIIVNASFLNNQNVGQQDNFSKLKQKQNDIHLRINEDYINCEEGFDDEESLLHINIYKKDTVTPNKLINYNDINLKQQVDHQIINNEVLQNTSPLEFKQLQIPQNEIHHIDGSKSQNNAFKQEKEQWEVEMLEVEDSTSQNIKQTQTFQIVSKNQKEDSINVSQYKNEDQMTTKSMASSTIDMNGEKQNDNNYNENKENRLNSISQHSFNDEASQLRGQQVVSSAKHIDLDEDEINHIKNKQIATHKYYTPSKSQEQQEGEYENKDKIDSVSKKNNIQLEENKSTLQINKESKEKQYSKNNKDQKEKNQSNKVKDNKNIKDQNIKKETRIPVLFNTNPKNKKSDAIENAINLPSQISQNQQRNSIQNIPKYQIFNLLSLSQLSQAKNIENSSNPLDYNPNSQRTIEIAEISRNLPIQSKPLNTNSICLYSLAKEKERTSRSTGSNHTPNSQILIPQHENSTQLNSNPIHTHPISQIPQVQQQYYNMKDSPKKLKVPLYKGSARGRKSISPQRSIRESKNQVKVIDFSWSQNHNKLQTSFKPSPRNQDSYSQKSFTQSFQEQNLQQTPLLQCPLTMSFHTVTSAYIQPSQYSKLQIPQKQTPLRDILKTQDHYNRKLNDSKIQQEGANKQGNRQGNSGHLRGSLKDEEEDPFSRMHTLTQSYQGDQFGLNQMNLSQNEKTQSLVGGDLKTLMNVFRNNTDSTQPLGSQKRDTTKDSPLSKPHSKSERTLKIPIAFLTQTPSQNTQIKPIIPKNTLKTTISVEHANNQNIPNKMCTPQPITPKPANHFNLQTHISKTSRGDSSMPKQTSTDNQAQKIHKQALQIKKMLGNCFSFETTSPSSLKRRKGDSGKISYSGNIETKIDKKYDMNFEHIVKKLQLANQQDQNKSQRTNQTINKLNTGQNTRTSKASLPPPAKNYQSLKEQLKEQFQKCNNILLENQKTDSQKNFEFLAVSEKEREQLSLRIHQAEQEIAKIMKLKQSFVLENNKFSQENEALKAKNLSNKYIKDHQFDHI